MSSHPSSRVSLVNPVARERTSRNLQALVEQLSRHLSFSELIQLREFVRDRMSSDSQPFNSSIDAAAPSAISLGATHSIQLPLNPRALLECMQRSGLFEDNEPSGLNLIRNFLKSIGRYDLLPICTFRSPLPGIGDCTRATEFPK